MQKVNMHEAKIHLSRYVDLAAGGEEILIAGESVARLVALTAEQSQQRSLGLGKAHFKIPDQFDNLHQDLIEQMFPTKTDGSALFSARHAYFPRSTVGLRLVASSYPD